MRSRTSGSSHLASARLAGLACAALVLAPPGRGDDAPAADRLYEVGVRVEYAAGGAPPSARLRYGRGRRGPREEQLWTPPVTSLRLPPGRYYLSAMAGEDEVYASAPVAVEVAAGEGAPPGPVTLVLRERAGVRGRVRPREGEELPAVRVYAYPYPAAGVPDGPDDRIIAASRRTRALRGTDYAFHFWDLSPGAYVIAASRIRGQVEVERRVEVRDAVVSIDLELPPLDPSRYLVLRVSGPDGQPLRDLADVRSGFESGAGATAVADPWIQRADGSVLVLGDRVWAGDSTTGQHFLDVLSASHGSRRLWYERGAEPPGELAVVFAAPATVDVALSDLAECPYRDRLGVILERAPGAHAYVPVIDGLDEKGRVRFGPAQPGAHTIHFTLRTESEAHEVHHVPIEAASGANRVELPVPRLHALEVVVDQPPAGRARILVRKLHEDHGFTDSAWAEAGGRTNFEGLPAGEYGVRLSAPGAPPERRVRVPEERVLRIHLETEGRK